MTISLTDKEIERLKAFAERFEKKITRDVPEPVRPVEQNNNVITLLMPDGNLYPFDTRVLAGICAHVKDEDITDVKLGTFNGQMTINYHIPPAIQKRVRFDQKMIDALNDYIIAQEKISASASDHQASVSEEPQVQPGDARALQEQLTEAFTTTVTRGAVPGQNVDPKVTALDGMAKRAREQVSKTILALAMAGQLPLPLPEQAETPPEQEIAGQSDVDESLQIMHSLKSAVIDFETRHDPRLHTILKKGFSDDELIHYIGSHEGKITYLYADSKGYVTVGKGHLTSLKEAKRMPFKMRDKLTGVVRNATAHEIEQAWRKVKDIGRVNANENGNSKSKLTAKRFNPKKYNDLPDLFLEDAYIDFLERQDVREAKSELKRKFKEFDTFPAAAQMALMDMEFNMGIKFSRAKWPTTYAAIERGDWDTVSRIAKRRDIKGDRNKVAKQLFELAHLSSWIETINLDKPLPLKTARAYRERMSELMEDLGERLNCAPLQTAAAGIRENKHLSHQTAGRKHGFSVAA